MLSAQARVVRLNAACSLAGGAGIVTLVLAALLGGRSDGPWVPLSVAFTAAILISQWAPIRLTHRGQSEGIRMEEAFFVPMAVLLSPVESLITVAAAIGFSAVLSGRGLAKGVFNTGMLTFAWGLGLGVAHWIGLDGSLGGREVAAVVTGGLVFCAASSILVAGIISLASGSPFRGVLFDGTPVRLGTWLGSLSLGVLAVMAAEGHPLALVVALAPALALQYGYSGAVRQWRERREADAMYEAAGRIRATVSSAQVREELIGAAQDLLGAGSAQVVDDPASPTPSGVLRVALGDTCAIEVADHPMGGVWTRDDTSRLQALAAVASGALDNALLYEQLQAVTRSLGEGVLALDEHGLVTFANPAAEQLLGWGRGCLLGTNAAGSFDAPADRARDDLEWGLLPRLREGETVRLEEHTARRSDGASLDVALTASPVRREGVVVGAVAVFRDVTERKALERRLVHQAFHDQLTGLPTRALFLDRLEHARTRGRDTGSMQAVLFLDVDRFKLLNDSLGHRVGDDVLCTIASRLVGAVRQGDTVARFGGDEFTVLLEQMSGPNEATATAERILQSLRQPVVAGDRQVVLSVSIGIAVAEPGNVHTDLLAAADIAMYEAKRTGKDRFCIAAADADALALARLDLEMELRRAISGGELELHYQPVLNAHTGRLYGFEALVRWRHPQAGLLAPSEFMELAEDSGLVLPLGEWVLDQACRTARNWLDEHPDEPAVMAVNLSARQFQDPDLCARVAAVLQNSRIEPSALVLEITETVVMGDTERTLATLRALKRLGVRLAIDDFGTGYSSLSYLKRFPVDIVKIDRSFVDGLGDSPVDREIVAAVIRLAAAVGMQTVAEGVETPAQLEQLRLLGCSLVQGYLFAAPQPLADLERALARAALAVPSPRSTVG